mmetsp:Transcript_1535/g.2519  ORF Transcript_1535/g.2519 Transcript_1535/m.2519 type:complete len:90 (+) Transcript_1535:1486-1755(+)
MFRDTDQNISFCMDFGQSTAGPSTVPLPKDCSDHGRQIPAQLKLRREIPQLVSVTERTVDWVSVGEREAGRGRGEKNHLLNRVAKSLSI